MSIFGSILEKLGIKKPEDQAKPVAPVVTTAAPPAYTHDYVGTPITPQAAPITPPAATAPKSASADFTPGHGYEPPVQVTPAKPAEMPMVDVVTHLDYLAKTGPIQGLNWRMSINDLMALLGLEHSPQAIRDLAVELGCPEKEMMDSYTRNVWTHQTLLKKIAENGGNIPPELMH
jgi:hypothetical protein